MNISAARRAALVCVCAGSAVLALAVLSGQAGSTSTRASQPAPSSGAATPKTAGPLDSVRAQVRNPDRPFTLLVTLTLKPGAEVDSKFIELATAVAKGTRAEPGNIAYAFNRDAKDPRHIVLYEEWRSLHDLELHFETEHLKKFLAASGELTEPSPSVAVYLPVSNSQ